MYNIKKKIKVVSYSSASVFGWKKKVNFSDILSSVLCAGFLCAECSSIIEAIFFVYILLPATSALIITIMYYQ